MRKERIKSIILILLIANCLQLTAQIWFDKKLWPSGYNFFSSYANSQIVRNILKHIPFINNNNNIEQISVTQPKKIVINGGGAREVYYDNQKQYADALSITNKIVNLLFKETPNAVVITNDQWESFLKGKSIFVDFGFNIDMNNIARTYGATNSNPFSQITLTSNLIITNDKVTNEVIVCIKDYKTDIITKYNVAYNGDELLKYIEKMTYGKQQNNAFAFELNLDSPNGTANVKRKVTLEPLVLLPMNQSNLNVIKIINPINKETQNIGSISDEIVKAFDYNPSSLRKTITGDGVVSYVENKATVKIYPTGLVEYNAVLEGSRIITGGKIDSTTIVNQVTKIAREVWKNAGMTTNLDVRLSSDLIDYNDNKYVVKLNYIFEGIPVITQLNEQQPMNNAIVAVIENGYLKSFKMVLRGFDKTNEKATGSLVLTAIDRLFAMYGQDSSETKIDDIFQCYASEGSEKASPMWGVKLAKDEAVIIVP